MTAVFSYCATRKVLFSRKGVRGVQPFSFVRLVLFSCGVFSSLTYWDRSLTERGLARITFTLFYLCSGDGA